MEMEQCLNKTCLIVSSQQVSLPSTSYLEANNLIYFTCIEPDPNEIEMEQHLNENSLVVSSQEMSLLSTLSHEAYSTCESTYIKPDPDEMEYSVNKTSQDVSNQQIPLPCPLKCKLKEEIMYCQFCPYSDVEFDRLKFHTFTQHPNGAAVVSFGKSDQDFKFFCVKETCNFSTTICTVYEEHLMNCFPLHQSLSGKEKERLNSTLQFVFDFYNKHCLSDVTGLLEYLSSFNKTYRSKEDHVQSRKYMEHPGISIMSRSSSLLDVQSSMVCGEVSESERKLEAPILSDLNPVPVFIVQNQNRNLSESQTRNFESISTSVRNQKKNNELVFKTDPSEMKNRKSLVHTRLETQRGRKLLPCEHCERCFQYRSDLVRHMRVHSGEKPFICNICDKEFSRSSVLIVHKRTHTGEKPYKCDVCDKCFVDSSTLIKHKRTHTDVKPFNCDVCDKTFTRSSDLIGHRRSHTGEKPHKCDVCDKGCADVLSDPNPVPVFIFQNQNRNLSESQTRNFESISTSVRNQNKNNELVFKTDPSEMKNSKSLVHTRLETQRGRKPLPCEQCEKCFQYRSDLVRHMRVHSGEKPFICNVCDKEFARSCVLIVHKRTHTGEKPYKCDACNKYFADSSTLIKHKRTHTGEKPFNCDVCDKTFTRSRDLIGHRRSHTGEKPYKCDVCDKGCSDSSTLNVHKRTHTGEKPFKCDVCDKNFTRSRNLIIHKRTHTGEKPFRCDACDKRFTDSSTLIKHKRTHT